MISQVLIDVWPQMTEAARGRVVISANSYFFAKFSWILPLDHLDFPSLALQNR